MNFLEPWGLLGLAALAPVIALYFLKLKRKQRVVPSTLLWKKAIDDMQANAPFQRLKHSLILYIQMILLALLGFALARPYLSTSGYAGRKTVLMIDTSASMATRDAGAKGLQTRLEAAIEGAIARVNDMRRGDEICILAFDRGARQLCKFSNDKGSLRAVLEALDVREIENSQTEEAFETAQSIIDGQARGEVLVLSDGCFGKVGALHEQEKKETLGNIEDKAAKVIAEKSANKTDKSAGLTLNGFSFVSFGSTESDNVGITRMDARGRPVKAVDDNGKAIDALETQVFVLLENFSTKPKEVVLTLSTETEKFSPHVISLQARPSESFLKKDEVGDTTTGGWRSMEVFKLPVGTTGIVTAHIDGPKDSFATDDTASAIITDTEEIKLLLVTKGNFFLERAIGAMRSVDGKKLSPEEFNKQWDQLGHAAVDNYDACIFDTVAPPNWNDGGALFLGVMPPVTGFSKGEKRMEWPPVVDWDSSHPVMRYVNFSNVTVASAEKWTAPRQARWIVEGPGVPLIASMESDRLRVIGVAFDIFSSDWAYRPSLPLFLRNVIPWVAEASPRRQPAAQKTGDTLAIPPGVGAGKATLLRPGGMPEAVELTSEHATYVKGTEKSGLYQIKDIASAKGVKDRTYAFNLSSLIESENAAAGKISVGGESFVSSPAAVEARREIWRDLAWIALALLLAEWWIFHRRVGF